MPFKDIKMKRKYQNKWKKKKLINNKKHFQQIQEKHREKRRRWFTELKMKFSCIECGESDPRCLDFHHRDPKSKKDTISRIVTNNSINDVMKELKKCDPLCSNCHRKITVKYKFKS